jgi:micrococcal nuclease
MSPFLQSTLWFAAGLLVSAAIILIGHNDPASDAAPASARVEAAAFRGSVSANVVRVIDGDTFEADAQIWLGQSVDVRVRIEGIDAPELHARCDAELHKAELARDTLAKRINGASVWLSGVRYDKYGGRIRATVTDDQGDVGQAMLAKGLARPYHGERRGSWCDAA